MARKEIQQLTQERFGKKLPVYMYWHDAAPDAHIIAIGCRYRKRKGYDTRRRKKRSARRIPYNLPL